MTVALHNPASIPVTGTRIPVPDSKFTVLIFNQSAGNFTNYNNVYMDCFEDKIKNRNVLSNCFIEIPEIVTPAFGFNLLKIIRN